VGHLKQKKRSAKGDLDGGTEENGSTTNQGTAALHGVKVVRRKHVQKLRPLGGSKHSRCKKIAEKPTDPTKRFRGQRKTLLTPHEMPKKDRGGEVPEGQNTTSSETPARRVSPRAAVVHLKRENQKVVGPPAKMTGSHHPVECTRGEPKRTGSSKTQRGS